ncbi:MAG: IS1 family transposase [Rectinemataceae bacterium]|nr:IS1 family transposase [Rectinemataceae bacterium]
MSTPKNFMMSWFLFPPLTKEVQLDERWSFVGKKEKMLEKEVEADTLKGDLWDHTAIDAESRLLISLIPGKRTAGNCVKLIEDVKQRTDGRPNILFTSDEHAPYEKAIEKAYAKEVPLPRKPGPGRNPKPVLVMPPELVYGTVRKTRKQGRVVQVVRSLIFGTLALLAAYLLGSTASTTINTSFVERNNGTERGKNARKARKTLCFSKTLEIHNAVSYFVGFGYNFLWPVRTLALDRPEGRKSQRTPAMAAGLTDHIWSLKEWCTFPVPSS